MNADPVASACLAFGSTVPNGGWISSHVLADFAFGDFAQALVSLFVAVDPVGLVPIFLAVTATMTAGRRREISFQAVAVASVLTLAFMFLGQLLFQFLGIRDADFRIGGGLILLVLAITDLCMHGKPAVEEDDVVGIVPLAVPMIAGPATLTSLLVLRGRYGTTLTIFALAINLLIVLGLMLASGKIAKWVGPAAMRGLSKLVMVLLAAIAVNFIRTGVEQLLQR